MDLLSFKEFVKQEEAKKSKNDKDKNDVEDTTPIPEKPKTNASVEIFN